VSDDTQYAFDQRFLLVAPTGRDAPLTCGLLKREGFTCLECKDIEELCWHFTREGAAGLLIAEEVLVKREFARLRLAVASQAAWSDVPILLFTATSTRLHGRVPSQKALALLGNVTLLERPVRPITMLSAASAALRARKRQYMAREELSAQQQAVRQRDQFLAMLGHELRNPLSAIALANSFDDTEQTSARYAVIDRQVQHLTRLVDDLLDVARVTSGKIALQREHVDLTELVQSCFALLKSTFGEQLTVKFTAPTDPIIVHGDPVRLEQVVTNLLTNARKYTPANGMVSVSLSRAGEDAVLCVSDTGIGLAPDMLERVFDLFAQADGTLDRAKGGLGIGLTLVRRLVALHGGDVTASSSGLGQGSTFQVRLPRVSRAVAPVPTRSPIRVVNPQQRQYQVLIVEDNPDSRELLARLLERLGHRVYAAEDGPTGVEEALARRPDVLLVDIGLPGLDGYGVARQVRNQLGRDVYMIALTGYGQPDDRRRALDAGFDAHFTKPLDVHAIDELLSREQLLSAAPR
jgi:signal transduction histidine kinase/CheY-like chemotaxis protein